MQTQFKWLFSLLLTPVFAFANQGHFQDSPQGQVQSIDAPPPPIHHEVTPSHGTMTPHNVDIAINAEFLWWYASIGNLPYAKELKYITRNNTDPSLITEVLTGQKNFDVSWDPGLRVGVDVITNHDGWNISADWNYFYNS